MYENNKLKMENSKNNLDVQSAFKRDSFIQVPGMAVSHVDMLFTNDVKFHEPMKRLTCLIDR